MSPDGVLAAAFESHSGLRQLGSRGFYLCPALRSRPSSSFSWRSLECPTASPRPMTERTEPVSSFPEESFLHFHSFRIRITSGGQKLSPQVTTTPSSWGRLMSLHSRSSNCGNQHNFTHLATAPRSLSQSLCDSLCLFPHVCPVDSVECGPPTKLRSGCGQVTRRRGCQ
jgi:hypothetical protein